MQPSYTPPPLPDIITRATAHPAAQKMMPDSFYWDPADESAPFGNDEGFDAFYRLREWRPLHPAESPVILVHLLLSEWAFPPFDLNSTDTVMIRKYVEQKRELSPEIDQTLLKEEMKKMSEEAGKEWKEEDYEKIIGITEESMGAEFMRAQNNAVIAIGLGQLVLEGKIDEDLKILTLKAIDREATFIMLKIWAEFSGIRLEHLQKIRSVVESADH